MEKQIGGVTGCGVVATGGIAMVLLLLLFSPTIPIIGPLLSAEADRAATARNDSQKELVIAQAEGQIFEEAAKALAADRCAAHAIQCAVEKTLTILLMVGVLLLLVLVTAAVAWYKVPQEFRVMLWRLWSFKSKAIGD